MTEWRRGPERWLGKTRAGAAARGVFTFLSTTGAARDGAHLDDHAAAGAELAGEFLGAMQTLRWRPPVQPKATERRVKLRF